MSQLACSSCPFPADLSRLSVPGCPSSGCPVRAVLSRLSCLGCSVLAVLSQLSCPCCPVPAVLSKLLCPSCPVPAILSQRSCPGCPVPAVLSRLSCLGYPNPASCSLFLWSPSYSVPAVLSWFKRILFSFCDVFHVHVNFLLIFIVPFMSMFIFMFVCVFVLISAFKFVFVSDSVDLLTLRCKWYRKVLLYAMNEKTCFIFKRIVNWEFFTSFFFMNGLHLTERLAIFSWTSRNR